MTLPMHSPIENTDVLCEYCEGYYLVTTRGSTHLWHPEGERYMRMPGEHSMGLVPDKYNNVWLEPVEFVRWPEVGKTFYVILPEGKFHLSSTVASIELVTKHGLPRDES